MSLGFTLDESFPAIDVPAMDIETALFVLQRNSQVFVWNTLATFENNPVTLAQTETIMAGQSVSGLRLAELDQVRRYATGLARLVDMIKKGEFALDQRTACAIHGIVGREEALAWGVFRKHQVHINSVSYVPPAASELAVLATEGFAALSDIPDGGQRAVAAFLWLSRTQFFYDCNKRTATLMMVGELVSNGLAPLFVRAQDQELFNTRMREFYDTGDALRMFGFFADTAKDMYEQWDMGSAKMKAPKMGL
jgi:Fic family protein